MSEIAMLAGIAAIGSAATFTAWPFLTGRVDEREYLEAGPEEEIGDQLVCLEERARSSLSHLEAGRERGRISTQDYQSEKKRLQKTLRLIDRHFNSLQAGRLPSDEAIAELEDEILGEEEPTEPNLEIEDVEAEMELPPPARTSTKAPTSRSSVSKDTPLTCPACGHAEEEADAAFCGRCGTALACRSCGQPIRDPEAAFCGRCGGALRSRGAKERT